MDKDKTEEQQLIDYVVNLYYYPKQLEYKPHDSKEPVDDKKLEVALYKNPSQYHGYVKWHYSFNKIPRCLFVKNIIGQINAKIESHTICISLCEEHKGCKGGLYSKDRKKCYILKEVEKAEVQTDLTEPTSWTVFYFYKDETNPTPRGRRSVSDEEKKDFCFRSTTVAVTTPIPEDPDKDRVPIELPSWVKTALPKGTEIELPDGTRITVNEGIQVVLPDGEQVEIDESIETKLPEGVKIKITEDTEVILPEKVTVTVPDIRLPDAEVIVPNDIEVLVIENGDHKKIEIPKDTELEIKEKIKVPLPENTKAKLSEGTKVAPTESLELKLPEGIKVKLAKGTKIKKAGGIKETLAEDSEVNLPKDIPVPVEEKTNLKISEPAEVAIAEQVEVEVPEHSKIKLSEPIEIEPPKNIEIKPDETHVKLSAGSQVEIPDGTKVPAPRGSNLDHRAVEIDVNNYDEDFISELLKDFHYPDELNTNSPLEIAASDETSLEIILDKMAYPEEELEMLTKELMAPEKDTMNKAKSRARKQRLRVKCLASKRRRRGLGSSCTNFKDIFEKSVDYVQNLDQKLNMQIDENLISNLNEKLTQLKSTDFGEHFKMLGKAGEALTFGVFAFSLIQQIVNGDFKGIAINVGFFVYGFVAAELGEKARELGEKLGERFLGRAMNLVGPMLRGVGLGFAIYNFVTSLQTLNSNDTDSIVNAVASGIIMGIEIIDIAVMAAEALGIVAGVSAVTGPIGMVIGAVVMIGVQIYFAVKEVNEIKKMINLNSVETFTAGIEGLFGYVDPYFVELAHDKAANNALRDFAIEQLQKSDTLKMYFTPTGIVNNGHIQKQGMRTIDMRSLHTIYYDRTAPDNKDGYNVICEPAYKTHHQKPVMDGFCKWAIWIPLLNYYCVLKAIEHLDDKYSKSDYFCNNAFGVIDTNSHSKKSVHFELGDGHDNIFGSSNENSYKLGNGFKSIIGNNLDDLFILYGNTTNGTLEGGNGRDVVFAKNFHTSVSVNFASLNAHDISINHYVKEHKKREFIKATSIEDIRGRLGGKDTITVPCDLKYLDTMGGEKESRKRDTIFFTKDCAYDVVINVAPETVIKNRAEHGRFIYHLQNLTGYYFLYLNESQNQTNIFSFGYNIEDLVDGKNEGKSVRFMFTDHLDSKRKAVVSVSDLSESTIFVFKSNTSLRIHQRKAYLNVTSNLSRDELIAKYKPIVQRLGLVLITYTPSPDSVGVMIGHGDEGFGEGDKDLDKNILPNDPLRITHIIPGSVTNIYLISANKQGDYNTAEEAKFPDVLIFFDKAPTKKDEVDASVLAQHLHRKLKLDLKVNGSIDSTNKDITLEFYVNQAEKVVSLGKVILKNAIPTNAFKNTVVLITGQMAINVIENKNNQTGVVDYKIKLTPLPLEFTNEHHVLVITEADVAFNNEVKIQATVDKLNFLKINESLIVTNAADVNNKVDNYNFTTLMVYDYFESPKMQSIFVRFQNAYLSLKTSYDSFKSKAVDATDLFNHIKGL